MKTEPVFLEHDGGIDDLLSLLLILTMDNKSLIGVNVTPADCFIEPALESTYKILQLFHREEIPIGRCDFNGVNAFPSEWRARPEVVNALPMLINLPTAPDPYSYPDAADLLIAKISESPDPVSIIVTGPCSNVVRALNKAPSIRGNIQKIVWMGGAFQTQGNVQTYQHNGSAEWNVFWDPESARQLFEMELPLVCIPLDVTNHVPVNKTFLSRLAMQSNCEISNLAGQFWAMTIDTIPSYHYVYFMWDVLATSYLDIPEEFTVSEVRAKVSVRPPNSGQTYLNEEGNQVKIATDVNKNVFYEYVLNKFRMRLN